MFPESPDEPVLVSDPAEEVMMEEAERGSLALRNTHPTRSLVFKLKISEGGNRVVRLKPCAGIIKPGEAAEVELVVKDRDAARPVYRLLLQHVLAPLNVHSGSARLFWDQVAAQTVTPRSAKLDLVIKS